MEAMEAREMEVDHSHSGNKLHFLLLQDVKKRGIDIVAENNPQAVQNTTETDNESEPWLPPAPEETPPKTEAVDEFEAVVNSEAWQEMSMLKQKHFKLYAQVTGGRTPRTAEAVQYVIDEIVRLSSDTGDSDGMPEA